MFQNFFKVIFRYLLRNRFFTGLNLAGLSIGTASCIVIFLFVRNELSYDQFHRDGDDIYRLLRVSQINGMPYNIGITSAPFAEAILQDYEGRISSATRALSFNSLIRFGEKAFIEEQLLLADSNFFEFFSYPLSKGDPSSVLDGSNALVVSEALARKYFGDEDPIGKVVRMDGTYDLEITGVMAALPGNTHLRFDAVASIGLVRAEPWFTGWWSNSFYTYVKVPDATDVDMVKTGFPAFMEKYFGDDFARIGNKIGLDLEPLRDIYFNFDTRYEENIAHGDRRYVYVFASVGLLLVLLAAINYVNLATAQAAARAREVGVRKTLGSSRARVAGQFMAESFFLCLLSVLIGAAIAQIVIPPFNAGFGLSIPDLTADGAVWIFLIGLVTFGSLFAGAYPAFVLSGFRPVKVLKGQVRGGLEFLFVRKALVVFQFGMSVFMIIATLFVGKQLRYMREKDLGFSPHQLMVVDMNNPVIQQQRRAFKESLLRNHVFVSASVASGHPGGFYDATTVHVQGKEENMRMRTLWCDEDLMETMGLSLAAGRFFSQDFPADSIASVLVNETAVRQLGWTPEEAIGKRVHLSSFDSTYKEIVGVVDDYHFTSLKEKIEPMVISYHPRRGDLLVKVATNDIHGAIAGLQEVWDTYQTGFPLEFTFLDDLIQRLYVSETRQGKVFTLFSIISLVIACLGILGLASYIAAQRTREIGIRKVMGATSRQVSLLLMKDLLRLVVVANVLAIPLGYFAIERWSESFAYRVPINAGLFVLGAVIVLGLAMLIVGLNASRVATKNPVLSLRAE